MPPSRSQITFSRPTSVFQHILMIRKKSAGVFHAMLLFNISREKKNIYIYLRPIRAVNTPATAEISPVFGFRFKRLILGFWHVSDRFRFISGIIRTMLLRHTFIKKQISNPIRVIIFKFHRSSSWRQGSHYWSNPRLFRFDWRRLTDAIQHRGGGYS